MGILREIAEFQSVELIQSEFYEKSCCCRSVLLSLAHCFILIERKVLSANPKVNCFFFFSLLLFKKSKIFQNVKIGRWCVQCFILITSVFVMYFVMYQLGCGGWTSLSVLLVFVTRF